MCACLARGTGYLCPLSANTFQIEFLEFKIREMEGQKRELYHVKKPDDAVSFSPVPRCCCCGSLSRMPGRLHVRLFACSAATRLE